MRILRRADYRRMPWKNGGGTTEEIAREPAAGDSFLWRLSMAHIDAPGPFSDFSGYTRVMVLLSGNGLTLRCAGEADRVLRDSGDLVRFDGSLSVHCSLHDGSCTDLNLMVSNRRRFDASVETLSGPATLSPLAGQNVIVVALTSLSLVTGTRADVLAPADTALLEPGDQATLESGAPGPVRAFIARITAG